MPPDVVVHRLGPDDAGELLTLHRAAYVSEARLHDDFDLPPPPPVPIWAGSPSPPTCSVRAWGHCCSSWPSPRCRQPRT